MRVSKQLARIESPAATNGQRIEIIYTRLDGDAPKLGQKAGQLITAASVELKDAIRPLKAGDEVVIVKTESEPNKDGKSYWNLTGIEPKESFVAKPKSSFGGYRGSSGGGNSEGQRNGCLFQNTVQMAIATKMTSPEEMRHIARDLISLMAYIEGSSKNVGIPTQTKEPEQKAKATIEKEKEEVADFIEDEDIFERGF